LFVPVQAQIKKFLVTIPQFPFQQGSSLNAAGINYQSLKAVEALKRLQEIETLGVPRSFSEIEQARRWRPAGMPTPVCIRRSAKTACFSNERDRVA
jgi:hypothetical protein